MSSHALPSAVDDERQLEELLARPSPADVAFARTLEDDLIVLGAGGKMGPSLARRARRALDQAGLSRRRVWAVSRFSDPGLAAALARDGVETLTADLLDPAQVDALPAAGNVLYLVGRKFGSTGRPDLTWAHNAVAAMLAARRFAGARVVVFSSGNVYAPVGPSSRGRTEADALDPIGEYAQSCLARERLFEYFSREHGARCVLLRLFYAVDLRYGTLVDIARAVRSGVPVDLRVARVNAVWQGDANSYALRSLDLAESPPLPLVVTGPVAVDVREAAERFGRLFGRPPSFSGEATATALLGNPSECVARLGPPEVSLERLFDWTADWVARSGRSLGKPTRFEATDGRF